MTQYTYQDGRIWVQEKKFQPYVLFLPYGITDITDPVGALNPVREPDPSKRRNTVVVDTLRGEPGLPGFTVETRFYKSLNYMIKAKTKNTNWQVHMGACNRPDNYGASEIGLGWELVRRGDLSADRAAQIQGDDAPIAVSVPMVANRGPLPIDFEVEFLSAQTIAETDPISDIAMIIDECDDISTQHDPGDNGYAVTNALAGSPVNVANVWWTANGGTPWAETSARPFDAGIDISSVAVLGDKYNHRVFVSNGTSGAAAAQIAYADVTVMGTTEWVLATVGVTVGQYITHIHVVDWSHVYGTTDDGYVYLSKDGGVTWEAILSLGTPQFNESSWLRNGVGWVGGASNTIYLTKDYGGSWSAITGPVAAGGEDINTIHVTPDGTVLIGTNGGGMYGSYNNGVEWTTLPAQGVTPYEIKRIRGMDDSTLWAILNVASDDNGKVVRSTDGGAQFKLWNLNTPANSGLNALFVVDPNYAYIGGNVQGSTAFVTKASSQIAAIPE
jgi:hypothetical protein